MRNDPLIPMLGVVTMIRTDTPDVKTFRVTGVDGVKPFEHIPGQCAMLSIPGVGEALFSITSSPTEKDFLDFSIKKCGCVTTWLHQMEVGQQVTIRGPYGNGFPVDTELAGKDLPDGHSVFTVRFEVKNVQELESIRNKLLNIRDVLGTRRGQN